MSHMMEAVQYSLYGGGAACLEHVEVPVPTPKREQVLIKVEAATINPFDLKVQSGAMKPVLPFKFPHIPGTDVAGEVVSVGPGVTTFVPGDKVVSWLGRNGGALAEYTVGSIGTTAKRPHDISAIEGAALGTCGFCALQSVRNSAGIALDGSPQKAKNLLITGASGGVGTLAVQIAKLGGAHVTVTCGARSFGLMKSLGADEVLDYDTPEGAAFNSPSGKKYDAIIHLAPYLPFAHFKPQLSATGFVIDLNPTPKGMFTSAMHLVSFSKQKCFPFVPIASQTDFYYLFNLIHQKKLKIVIDSTFPFARAQEAWAKCMEGHAAGKIVITCT